MAIRDSLALSQDQRALQESVRVFLAEKVSPGEMHSALDGQPGYSPELHARLTSELGLAGLTIPEEFGDSACRRLRPAWSTPNSAASCTRVRSCPVAWPRQRCWPRPTAKPASTGCPSWRTGR